MAKEKINLKNVYLFLAWVAEALESLPEQGTEYESIPVEIEGLKAKIVIPNYDPKASFVMFDSAIAGRESCFYLFILK